MVGKAMCQALWRDVEVSWGMQSANNTTGGDFNSIKDPDERFGSGHRLSGDSNIKEFNDWIDDIEVKKFETVLNKLEEDTSQRQLSPQKEAKRKQLQEALWAAALAHESLLRQKSRSRWIKEGDCNSRYFHLMMNANHRNNSLKGVLIDGIWIDEPHKVKEEVRSYLSKRFQEIDFHSPKLDGINFQTINQQHNFMLVAPFLEEEVRGQPEAVSDVGFHYPKINTNLFDNWELTRTLVGSGTLSGEGRYLTVKFTRLSVSLVRLKASPYSNRDLMEIIRIMLLLALNDPHKKICTTIGMVVASIAMHDWLELWPDLLPFLLNLINNQTNMNGVHRAMRCLVLLSMDLDDKMVPKLIPTMFSSFLKIVSSPQIYDPYIRIKALSIIYSCTSILGTMSGVYKEETSSLIVPLLKPWMGQFSFILQIPVQSENPDDWSIKMEVLKQCCQMAVMAAPWWYDMVDF
ncbi:Importin-9 [Glycine soja]|uniref:Importin-9 n=1 Tax=Glycine soja TaxID=3848 RepID=A0A445L0N3_GLYSO|nr:Importin-9 [Glycine soja]